jgi:hypothetical protein
LAFTTTTGANGVVSLVGTSGVDTAIISAITSNLYVGAQGANDVFQLALANGTNLASAFSVNGGAGNDTLNFGAGSTLTGSTINGDGGTGVAGNDAITLGTISASDVSAGSGDDTIAFANAQTSVINGNAGVDTITVNAGSVFSSSIFGGQGADTIGAAFAATVASNFVYATINGNKEGDQILLTATGFTNSTVFGGQGGDVITLTSTAAGAAAANTGTVGFLAYGDLGNDVITTSSGQDTVFGGEGDDQFSVGALGDTITMGAGSDNNTVEANNAGATVTAAASGAYIFTFAGTGADIITDFTALTAANGVNDRMNVTDIAGITTVATLGGNIGGQTGGADNVSLMRGTFASGVFTQSLTGTDLLVIGNGPSVAAAATTANALELTVLQGAGTQIASFSAGANGNLY